MSELYAIQTGALKTITLLESASFIGTILFAGLICLFLKNELSQIKQLSFLNRLLIESEQLLYATIYFVIFACAQVTFIYQKTHSSLFFLGSCLISAWLAGNVIYLLSDKKLRVWLIMLVIIPITLLHLFGLWAPFQHYLSQINFTFNSFSISFYKLLKSIVVLLMLFWFVQKIMSLLDSHLGRSKRFKRNEKMIVIQLITILSYLGAFFVALQILGIDLTVFALFGGAIGVGLGFGLQKITANFISGFILLFEKSIKVNDLIELGDGMLGFVRFTGARHTLIETYNGKDIMIPNEDFITQKVTNWTHSHNKARIDISIGVSYNSDLRKVKEIMLDAAKNHPRTAQNPEPSCYLDNFGDSAVMFSLFFWIDDIKSGRKTPKSDVLFAIWDAFKKEGIVIPFPQRDLHIMPQGQTIDRLSNKSESS